MIAVTREYCVDVLVQVRSAREQVTAVRECDLPAPFHWQDFVLLGEAFREDVEHADFVLKGYDEVETGGVESQSEAFLSEGVRELIHLGGVVPNGHCLVLGAGRDQLLLDAHVQTRDLLAVERAKHEVELEVLVEGVVVEDHGRGHHLTVRHHCEHA